MNSSEETKNMDDSQPVSPSKNSSENVEKSPAESKTNMREPVIETPKDQESPSTSALSETPDTPTTSSTGALRSSVHNAIAMDMVKLCKAQCIVTEEYALNYICEEIHHPAISCFREIKKSDINGLFGSNKWKRSFNEPVEQSILYLGILDYLAISFNNPLYEESISKTFSKTLIITIQKIMMDFKNMIGNWSMSEKDVIKKRSETITSHLRRLVPTFSAAGVDFGVVLDCIENDIVRIKANQERIKTSFPEESKSDTTTTNKSSSLITSPNPFESFSDSERSALGEVIMNFGKNILSEEGSSPNSENKIITTPTQKKPNQSKVRPLTNAKSPNVSSSTKKPMKSKSMAAFFNNQHQNKPASPQNDSNTPKSNNKRGPSESATSLNKSSSKKVKTTSTVQNVPSKTISCSSPSTAPTIPKPLVMPDMNKTEKLLPSAIFNGEKKTNAFAILMNKSREIAQANKMKKLAAESKAIQRIATA